MNYIDFIDYVDYIGSCHYFGYIDYYYFDEAWIVELFGKEYLDD